MSSNLPTSIQFITPSVYSGPPFQIFVLFLSFCFHPTGHGVRVRAGPDPTVLTFLCSVSLFNHFIHHFMHKSLMDRVLKTCNPEIK